MKRIARVRSRLAALLCAAVLPLAAAPAFAQYTADRPVRLIIPFAPGSGTDVAARLVIEPLSELIKRPIIPDNRPGALSIIGTEAAVKSAPDGHTLLMAGGAVVVSLPFMHNSLSFDPQKDLVPVYLLASSPLGLFVAADSPVKSVAELVALTKSQPGRHHYGSHVATNQIAMELFKQSLGLDLSLVRYKSAPQGLNDVASGQVTAMFADLSGSLPLARAGKIRALAVMKKTRSQRAPDVPSVYETGYNGFEVINWTGFFAPAKTPPELVRYVARQIQTITARPEFRERFEKVGLDLHTQSDPESFAAAIREETAALGPVIRRLGITAN